MLVSDTSDGLIKALALQMANHRVYATDPYHKCQWKVTCGSFTKAEEEKVPLEANKLTDLYKEEGRLEKEIKVPFIPPFMVNSGHYKGAYYLTDDQIEVNKAEYEKEKARKEPLQAQLRALNDQIHSYNEGWSFEDNDEEDD